MKVINYVSFDISLFTEESKQCNELIMYRVIVSYNILSYALCNAVCLITCECMNALCVCQHVCCNVCNPTIGCHNSNITLLC